MKSHRFAAFVLFPSSLFVTGLVTAQTAAPSQSVSAVGYTGLGLTPSFRPASWGEVAMGFQNTIPGSFKPKGYNFLMSAGVLPGVEINGRLATQDLQCNMYGLGDNPCREPYTRDLAASFKFGHSLELTNGWRIGASVGTTDYGGAATINRSSYGVGGVDAGLWSLTWGYGKASSPSSPLRGAFAQAGWRPVDEVQLYAEWLDHRSYAGVQAFLPAKYSPENTRFYVGAMRQLSGAQGVVQRQSLSAGVTVQLEKPQSAKVPVKAWVPEPMKEWGVSASEWLSAGGGERLLRASGPRNDGASPVIASGEAARQSPSTTPLKDLAGLAKTLATAGFEDISIGQSKTPDARWIIRVENSTYNWNDLDAVGVALSRLVKHSAGNNTSVELQLTRRGIVTFRLVTQTACIQPWLSQKPCEAGQAVQIFAGSSVRTGVPSMPAANQIDWSIQRERASLGRSRLYITPSIDSRVGTEYGTFDSTWGLNFTMQTPLWKGAQTDIAYVQALGHSSDYSKGAVFEDWRIDSLLHRVMIHQAVDIAPGLTGRVAVGRLVKLLDGAHGEIRWAPGDGTHRFSLEAAEFKHRQVDFKKTSTIGTYRYFSELLQTDFEVKGGQFWHGDKGTLLVTRHWFGDTSVALFLRRSKFPVGAPAVFSPFGSVSVNSAGIEFSFPLTPQKEYRGDWIQFRGDDRFAYGIQTVVGQRTGNYTTPYFGNFSPVPLGLDGTVFNFDRMSDQYVQSNLHRIRQAAEKFGE